MRHTLRLAVEGEPITWSDLTQVDPGELDHHDLVTLMRLADRIRSAGAQVRDAIGAVIADTLGDGAVLRYGAGYVQVGRSKSKTLIDRDGFILWLGNWLNAGEPQRVLRLFNATSVRKTGFPDYDRKKGSALFDTFIDESFTGDPQTSLRPIQASTAKWIADMQDGALWVPPSTKEDTDE